MLHDRGLAGIPVRFGHGIRRAIGEVGTLGKGCLKVRPAPSGRAGREVAVANQVDPDPGVRPAIHQVVTAVPLHRIGTGATQQRVVGIAAEDCVVAGISAQQIAIAGERVISGRDDIIAVTAIDRIDAAGGGDRVIANTSVDQILVRCPGSAADIDVVARAEIDGVGTACAGVALKFVIDGVIATARRDGVGTQATGKGVIDRTARDPVSAGTAIHDDRRTSVQRGKGVCRSGQRERLHPGEAGGVGTGPGDEDRPGLRRGDRDCHTGRQAAGVDRVRRAIGFAPRQGVIAERAVKDKAISPRAAKQAVVAIAAIQQIIAVVAIKCVAVVTTIQGIVSRAAKQAVRLGATIQQVLVGFAIKRVAVLAAIDGVVAGRTRKGVISPAAIDQVRVARTRVRVAGVIAVKRRHSGPPSCMNPRDRLKILGKFVVFVGVQGQGPADCVATRLHARLRPHFFTRGEGGFAGLGETQKAEPKPFCPLPSPFMGLGDSILV